MRSLGIVVDEVLVEHGLHLLDGLKPGASTFDAEMLVEKRAVPALDNAVGLRPRPKTSAREPAVRLFGQLLTSLVGTSVQVGFGINTGASNSARSMSCATAELLGRVERRRRVSVEQNLAVLAELNVRYTRALGTTHGSGYPPYGEVRQSVILAREQRSHAISI